MNQEIKKNRIKSILLGLAHLLSVPFLVIFGVILLIAGESLFAAPDNNLGTNKLDSLQQEGSTNTILSMSDMSNRLKSALDISAGKFFDLGVFRWSKDPLNVFYTERNYQFVWIDSTFKKASPKLSSFVKYLQNNSHLNGLRYQEYWTPIHDELYKSLQESSSNPSPRFIRNLINLEIAMTQSYISFAAHLSNGRLNPEQIKSKKSIGEQNRKTFEAGDVYFMKKNFNTSDYIRLNQIVNGEDINVGESVEAEFSTNFHLYKSLIEMLRHFYKISEETDKAQKDEDSSTQISDPERLKWIWQKISSPGVTLSLSQRHPVISKIKRRFVQMGYEASDFQSDIYDEEFDKSLQKFQAANRIGVGSSIGVNSQVWSILGKDLKSDIIPSIEANIERVRWLPRDIGSRYALVNTARSRFELYDGNSSPVMNFRTINGTPENQTPMMPGMIKEVVLNPVWNVPDEITLNEFVPQILRIGPRQWFSKNSMRLKDLVENRFVAEVEDFNWEYFDKKNYLLVQDSGDFNALGLFKFPFSDSTSIYMHDTNRRDQFIKSKRLLSHGCIRLEKPLQLANYLLKGLQVNKTRDSANKVILDEQVISNMTEGLSNEERQTRTLQLPDKKFLPVYVLYLTTGITESGRFFFTHDSYQQDYRLKLYLKCVRNSYLKGEAAPECETVIWKKQST